MVDERLHVRTRDRVTEIEFDHPPINIYDVATRDALCEVLTGVIADPGVHVVVFTAAGDHFSAGADLKEFGTAPSLFAMRDARWGRDVWGQLRAVPVPMIASMHGNAVGFGFELALQCDLRIAADDCVVALPEARVGMLPAGGASQTLPRVVGTSAALAAVITGERVTAADALARGFVDEVVPRAELRAHTDARADAIAAQPSAAVRAAKHAVWAAVDLPLDVGLRRESDLAAALPPSLASARSVPTRRQFRDMPTQQGIVGPVPSGHDPEEYDKLRRRVLWKMPSGLYILGSRAGERRNGMTINWVTQLSFDPKLVGVSVEREAFTHELIVDGGVFTVNLVAQEDRAIVRKFTKPVEVDLEARTLNGFPFHDGASGAPVLDQAVAFVDCEVRQAVEIGGHTLFLGEIVDCGFQADEETPVLSMGDTRMNYGG